MRTTRQAKSPAFRYSPIVAALAVAFAPQALASPYEVTTAAQSGSGSLRDVITYANNNCDTNRAPTITFNIPGTGPFVMAQSATLMDFTCSVGDTAPYMPTVDGTSQPSWTPNTLPNGFDASLQIILDGTAYGGCGLRMLDAQSYGGILTVKGLEIRDYSTAGLCGNIRALGNRIINNNTGVQVYDASLNGGSSAIGDDTIQGRNVIGGNATYGIDAQYGGNVSIRKNFIGTLNGSNASANGTGIRSMGGLPSTLISNNVISGNTQTGLYIEQSINLTVAGNMIGVDVTGNSQLANGAHGVLITNTSISNGGPLLSGNTISGNSNVGIVIQDGQSVTLTGNMIGTNTAGTATIANPVGVLALCVSDLTLRTNTISGNLGSGVELSGVNDSHIESTNRIGTNAGGAILGNGGAGIGIEGGDCSTQNGSFNIISDNVIANNGEDGVAITNGIGNTLLGNTIRGNGTSGGKNININDSGPGPLPNDPPNPAAPGSPPYDTDVGPNNQQNYPTITSVTTDNDGTMFIAFRLFGAPLTTYRVDVFSNSPAAPRGGNYEGNRNVDTDANGVFNGSRNLSGDFDNVSLTATNLGTGDTSEFSPLGTLDATPSVFLSSEDLGFGNIPVGTVSPTQQVTFTSNGTAPYRITMFDQASCYGAGAFCYGGGFTCTTTCTTGLDYDPSPSPVCSLTARFEPMILGPQTTTVLICDNVGAPGTPSHTITLTGTGITPPIFSIIPGQWDFGNTLVGQESAVKSFAIHNPGSTDTAIGALSTSGAFRLVSTTCAGSIPAGSSCFGSVAFAPTQPGFTTGSLSVAMSGGPPQVLLPKVDEGPPTSASALLGGTGIQSAALQMPSSVNLPAFALGGAPVTKDVQLTNSGNAVLSITNISTSAPFTVVNNCPPNLAPGASCIATVSFTSTQVGPFNGTLTVVSNAPGGSRAIPVTVVSQPSPNPLIHVVPTFMGFASRMFGTQSETQRITIANDGGAAASLSTMSVGIDYLITGTTCGLTLGAAASCFADVAFRPLGFGPRPGQFAFSSNSPNSPHVVEMLGTGCRPFSISGRAGAASACAP